MLHIKKLLAPNFLLLIALLYTLLIAIGSLMDSSSLGALQLPFSDKILHGIGYCLFVLFWFMYFFLKKRSKTFKGILWKIVIAGLLYGIIIEVLQHSLTSSRQADLNDILANIAGLLFAFILVTGFKARLIKLKNSI